MTREMFAYFTLQREIKVWSPSPGEKIENYNSVMQLEKLPEPLVSCQRDIRSIWRSVLHPLDASRPPNHTVPRSQR